MKTTLVADNATYTTTEITVKGNKYSVMVVTGKYNYINISKLTNNPFLMGGKTFQTWDEAASNYKSPEMKTELLKIELGIS